MDWASLVIASLLSGATLGEPLMNRLTHTRSIDALAVALADAPHQVRTAFDARASHLQGAANPALATETLALVTPLADRLGFAQARARLEDDSFRVLDPAAYEQVARAVGPAPAIAPLISQLRDLLRAAGLDAVVTGRTKSLFSVYQKQLRKGVAAQSIYDRIGLRVQLATEADCYAALDQLHHVHPPLVGEFDDYIAHPKPSGYQSLHTAVWLNGGPQVAEIQLRTFAMHEAAESGDQAHWRYKLGA